MNRSDFELTSKHGHKMSAYLWMPKKNAKGAITLVHGFGEHCLRYIPYLEFFLNEDFAVLGFDQQGHGQTKGKKGCIKSFDSLLDDIDTAVEKLKELFPDIPHFIYGHSMGGNLSMNYIIRHKPQLNGAVISSPWLKLAKDKNFIEKGLVSILRLIIPRFTIDAALDIKYISTNKEEVEKYKNDSLNHGRMSMRLAYSTMKNGDWAILNVDKIEIPVLFTHGSADQITSPKATKQAANTNTKLFNFIEWTDRYHELHNESIRPELASKVISWMKSKM